MSNDAMLHVRNPASRVGLNRSQVSGAVLPPATLVTDEKSMTVDAPKYGFGIDEFLKEFKSLTGVFSETLKKAADCKKEKNRLCLLMDWAEELKARVEATRKTPQFEGKSLFQLDLIKDKLNRAFAEEVKKTRGEIKAPAPKVYDFGLKDFLQHYSIKIPAELNAQFKIIHEMHATNPDETHILEDLLGWARDVQKACQDDIEARKIMEAIKFRIRVALLINRVLNRNEEKSQRLHQQTKKANDELLKLQQQTRLVDPLHQDKITSVNKTLARMTEESKQLVINKDLLEKITTLLEGASPIELPSPLVCETKADKMLVDKVTEYKTRHDHCVQRFKPAVVIATMEIECEDVSQESTHDEMFELSYRLRAKRYSDEKFGLSSPSAIPALVEEGEVLSTSNTQKQEALEALQVPMRNLEHESKELRQTLYTKNQELAKLRNENVECARSVEVLKTQMFRSLPEVEKSKTVRNLNNIDQNYQQYKDSENKDEIIKQAAMTRWDILCEKIGLSLSARHVMRKAEVEKYFQSLEALSQLEIGVKTNAEAKIALSLNKLNIPQNYLDLWKSFCKKKNELSENTKTINASLTEIKVLQERLKKVQEQQSKLVDTEIGLGDTQEENNPKTAQPKSILGFSLE